MPEQPEPLYRIPGGVVLYTAADVEHLLRFYPAQEFVKVEDHGD